MQEECINIVIERDRHALSFYTEGELVSRPIRSAITSDKTVLSDDIMTDKEKKLLCDVGNIMGVYDFDILRNRIYITVERAFLGDDELERIEAQVAAAIIDKLTARNATVTHYGGETKGISPGDDFVSKEDTVAPTSTPPPRKRRRLL